MTEGASAAADKYADYSREQLLAEISRLKKSKKYGLVWEHKVEDVIQNFETWQPYLEEVAEKRIENAPDEPTNLIIEGDNFEALSVLNYTHAGKVDVIYIDPPYNTGNKDFIYNDNYVDSEDAFRHSKWLSFMEPRLKLAKSLLKDDGVILISIDDNEQASLRMLCDEIFENSLESMLIWKTKTAAKGVPPTNMIVTNHDYILMYGSGKFRFNGEKRDDSQFSNPDNDPRGVWKADNMKSTTSTKFFTITDPRTGNQFTKNWAFSEESIKKMIEDDRIIWPSNKKGTPRQKRFKSEYTNETMPLRTLIGEWQSETATNKLKDIFNTNKLNFNNPKPVELIKFLIEQSSQQDAVVLDFFAGSGTTGQAVLELSKEDGGHRQFILCTNNGDKGPDSTKIAEEITYPRVKTVITGARQDGSKYSDGIPANLRYYKIDHREKKQSLDANRQDFAYYIDDIIQVKENAFKQIVTEEDYSLYAAKDKYVATVTEPFALEEIVKRIAEINTDKLPLKLYVFSYSRDAFEENFDVDFDIEFAAMPEGLLKTYANIVAEQKKEDL